MKASTEWFCVVELYGKSVTKHHYVSPTTNLPAWKDLISAELRTKCVGDTRRKLHQWRPTVLLFCIQSLLIRDLLGTQQQSLQIARATLVISAIQ